MGLSTELEVYAFFSQDKETGAEVAIKKYHQANLEDGVSASTIRETGILQKLSHPNIVSLKDVIVENCCSFLVFEYAPQDLKRFIKNKANENGIDEETIRVDFFQCRDCVMNCCSGFLTFTRKK